jgi:hypothetical protein
MKTKTIFKLFMAYAVMLLAACEPIVDEATLSNNIADAESVRLVAVQSGSNGNLIELKMESSGIIGYWDFNIGRAYTDRVEFIYPIPGTQTFTFTGTLGGEFFTKTIDVQIDELDNPLPQDYTSLVSENTVTGKNWIFFAAQPWHMSNPANPEEQWWDAWTCCLADANGSMNFNLDGAANYTYFSAPGATPQAGSFALDIPNQTLVVSGAPILGGQDGGRLPGDGIFNIVSLTSNEMILHTAQTVAGDSGWTWKFVAQ